MNQKLELLIHALVHRDTLTERERSLIAALPRHPQEFKRGEEIVHEGDRPHQSCLLVHGFCMRVNHLASGGRQITALHIPGDFVDLHAMMLKKMDHGVTALTDCEVSFIPHEALIGLVAGEPHIGRLFWLLTLIDGAILREWLTGLGRRNPAARLAHLICELYVRLEVVGLVHDGMFSFPVTQSVLADVLGLSIVHMNRTLQELRNTGLITWSGGDMLVNDLKALSAFADFDPVYLNLTKEPR